MKLNIQPDQLKVLERALGLSVGSIKSALETASPEQKIKLEDLRLDFLAMMGYLIAEELKQSTLLTNPASRASFHPEEPT